MTWRENPAPVRTYSKRKKRQPQNVSMRNYACKNSTLLIILFFFPYIITEVYEVPSTFYLTRSFQAGLENSRPEVSGIPASTLFTSGYSSSKTWFKFWLPFKNKCC